MFSVAIDGPSGAGKSTVAKALAKKLDLIYLDTGAMYRCLGLKMLRLGISGDQEKIKQMLESTSLTVENKNEVQNYILDGEDVSGLIRTQEVAKAGSDISAFPFVRQKLVAMQRQYAEGNRVIMEGRDICMYVLPDAPHKFFLLATPELRAKRRYLSLRESDPEADYEKILEEINKRDYNDTTREYAPLAICPEAIIIDTTCYNADEVVDIIISYINNKEGIK